MFRRKRPLSDFSAELEAHVAIEIDRLRADGLSDEAARRQARRNLGNVLASEERFYEADHWLWLDHLKQDIHFALRRLRKTPAFTLTAIVTLALGIGATTAIFTLVNAIMLKSLPVTRPEQLYRLGDKIHCCNYGGYSQEDEFSIVSYELYKHFRDNTPDFEELTAFSAGVIRLAARRAGSANAADPCFGEFVSGNYFSTFGIRAFDGRAITPSDDQPGTPSVAVMSYAVWREKYGLDPSVIGSVFYLDNQPFTIVGVAPPGFFGDTLRDIVPAFWIPLASEPALQGPAAHLTYPYSHWLEIIGRVRPGVNAAALEARMKVELRQWLESHVADMSANDRSELPKQTLHLSPGAAGITVMRDEYRDGLHLLIIIAGSVLLIVCANLANLMLVRGIERRQQTSLSMALGAQPSRLIGQAFTESVLLALIGGAAGVGLAYAGTHALLHIAFPNAPLMAISARPSLPVLLFAFAISVSTGIAFGIAPAWLTLRTDPVEALRGAGRSTRESGSLPRKALMVLQAALSLALLCSAGLMTQSLRNLQHQDYGFARDGRWIVRFDPMLAGYRPKQLDLLYLQIHDRIMQIAGVLSVSESIYTPMSGDNWSENIFVAGHAPPGPNDEASWNRVSPGYFETVGHRIVRGRPITERDSAGSQNVAVINEAFARHFFKNEDPLGRHFGKISQEHAADYEIAGVAADAKYWSWDLRRPVRPMFFLPLAQEPGEESSHYLNIVALHAAPGVRGLEAQIRRAFTEINPDLPVIQVQSVADMVNENFTQQELIATLTSLFGLLALILACVGLYGVTAYAVGRRTAEIGIRIALGADQRTVMMMVLRGAFLLVAIGLAIGLLLTFALGRFLGSQLYGISSYDPLVVSGSIAALTLCGAVAGFIPARRAASISPMDALRTE